MKKPPATLMWVLLAGLPCHAQNTATGGGAVLFSPIIRAGLVGVRTGSKLFKW
jgi:hypothetical protein